ncbi:hypothetical protein GF374_02940 [Candidatus Woesearchaeota archaeon]|nr:hypothetical protein [Candidatus Woesearchaeota archaeon]
MEHELAKCIGLWLAEGDSKTKYEITFTNNCWQLVKLFSDTICKLFKDHTFNARIYVYSKKQERPEIRLPKHSINYYIDQRARKPYFIFRLASVDIVKKWKKITKEIQKDEKHYTNILSGFFAGEGNIKTGAHSNRTLRVAQKKPNNFIEKIFKNLKLTYKFAERNRSYVITGKWNWDIFAEYKIADLHPDKKQRFWKAYKEFKENHYPNLYLKREVYNSLITYLSAFELALKFNRSQARICDVLMELKKENKIRNFRVRSRDYWTKNKNLIIISKIKKKYLNLLKTKTRKTADFAKELGVNWKSANKRLKELEKLGLVEKAANDWILSNTRKEVVVL